MLILNNVNKVGDYVYNTLFNNIYLCKLLIVNILGELNPNSVTSPDGKAYIFIS